MKAGLRISEYECNPLLQVSRFRCCAHLRVLREFAFGHDDLTPVSKSFTDGRNGWGASVVDAMTTMVCSFEFSSQLSKRSSKAHLIAGPAPGWQTKTHNRYISKDRDLLKQLEHAIKSDGPLGKVAIFYDNQLYLY